MSILALQIFLFKITVYNLIVTMCIICLSISEVINVLHWFRLGSGTIARRPSMTGHAWATSLPLPDELAHPTQPYLTRQPMCLPHLPTSCKLWDNGDLPDAFSALPELGPDHSLGDPH